jgi:hypothetical protein
MAGTVPKSWFLAAGAVAQLAAAQSEDEWKALLAQAAAQMSCPVKQRSVQVGFPSHCKPNFYIAFSQCFLKIYSEIIPAEIQF